MDSQVKASLNTKVYLQHWDGGLLGFSVFHHPSLCFHHPLTVFRPLKQLIKPR